MTLKILLMILVMAGIVILLRALPFLIFARSKHIPAFLLFLGQVITAAAIAMLVVYSLVGNLDILACGTRRLLPALAAGSLTVALQYFFKNPMISIVSGTALFMVLV